MISHEDKRTANRVPTTEALSEWVHGLLRGEVSRREAMAVIAANWDDGSFLHRIPAADLPELRVTAPSRKRYLGSTALRNHVLYGSAGEPGCVLVVAPHDAAFKGDFRDLNVPIHVHDTDHVAVVVEGSGSFFVRKELRHGPAILRVHVRRGCVLFYPAGTPHTFAGGCEGLSVASFQCDFESPDSPAFARLPSEDPCCLPRVDYRDL